VSAGAELRGRQLADMLAAVPEHLARLEWQRSAIDRHRRRSLRLLLRIAKEYSPWYRERLRDIEPAVATEADLARIPPMTRDDLMDHWDEIVIYPGLDLAQAEAHLERSDPGAYLSDAFHVVASSGPGGRRGVFVYDWDSWVTSFLGCARWRLVNRSDAMASRRPRVALVASEQRGQIDREIHETFRVGELHGFAPTLPLEQIVAGLNAVQPDVLLGGPAMLRELAKEAQSGALEIRPAYVHCGGEPLEAALRRELAVSFGGRVIEGWSVPEALPLAQSCSARTRMHLNDDLVIVDPVDAQGEPVPPGTRSSRVYLTNLFSLALPLIRYEVADQVTISGNPCPCGSAHTTLESIGRRLDERFVYEDGIVVGSRTLPSALVPEPA
jgi:phenylacetate-coenzyme A ligase PaaK-like adenylate-forming protein